MAHRVDEAARLRGRVDPRRDQAVHTRVQDRRHPRAVGARQAHQHGRSRGARRNRERRHVARVERAVLEVDPDEVEWLAHQLGQRDVREREHRAQQLLMGMQARCEWDWALGVQECESYDDFPPGP